VRCSVAVRLEVRSAAGIDRRVAVVLRAGAWTRHCFRTGERGPRHPVMSPWQRSVDCRASRVHVTQSRVDGHVRYHPGSALPTPTTSSATATRSAAGRSVSTAATCRSARLRVMGRTRSRRAPSSGFLLERSAMGHRHTAASRSAGTALRAVVGLGVDPRVIASRRPGGGFDR